VRLPLAWAFPSSSFCRAALRRPLGVSSPSPMRRAGFSQRRRPFSRPYFSVIKMCLFFFYCFFFHFFFVSLQSISS
jgi:hypothetical protein